MQGGQRLGGREGAVRGETDEVCMLEAKGLEAGRETPESWFVFPLFISRVVLGMQTLS